MNNLLRHPLYRIAAREMALISLGMTAWAFMTGVTMIKSGMSIPEAVLTSCLVFAGSAQLAAAPLIAVGAPVWVIWAAAFCVNLRFVVFSLHLRDYVLFLPRARRLWLGFFMGDVTYVLFTRRFAKPARTAGGRRAQMAYLWGANMTNLVFWQVFSMLGIFLGAALPEQWELGFAGTLALLGMACSLVNSRERAFSALVAAAASLMLLSLPLKLHIVAAIAVAVAASLLLERRAPPVEI
jgi:predicted branched-subunit amino acid permease